MKNILANVKNIFSAGKPEKIKVAPAKPTAWDRRKVVAHFEKYFGSVDYVLEDETDINLHVIKPTSEKWFYTIFTTGMSIKPMYVPQNMDGYEYAELMIQLPGDWPMEEDGTNAKWPITWLRMLARMPEKEKTWLFYGHTVPNGDSASPFVENTGLGCFILGTTNLLENDEERNGFAMLELDGDKVIYCFTLFPIHKAEMEYKLLHSAQDLFSMFSLHEISEVINVQRESVI